MSGNGTQFDSEMPDHLTSVRILRLARYEDVHVLQGAPTCVGISSQARSPRQTWEAPVVVQSLQ